jgi:hypothetical protein
MHDSRPLVHAIAGRNERLLRAVHEARPAFEHDDDMKFRLMSVPSGALFRCNIGFYELREDLAPGRFRDAEIAIRKEVTQTFRFEFSVRRLHVRELGDRAFEHAGAP